MTPEYNEKKAETQGCEEKKKRSSRSTPLSSSKPEDKCLDLVNKKLNDILGSVRAHGERRNTYLNLAYTGPIDNTKFALNISFLKVANMAMDLFCDTSAVATAVAESATGADDTQPKKSPVEVIRSQNKKPWKIPEKVERGFEIPICLTDTTVPPQLGQFKRLHMDVVVNAVWLALFWAKTEDNREAASALKKLIIDWPMDFIYIGGATEEEREENAFKWAVNKSATVERLREFVGLENQNLMRIVNQAASFCTADGTAGKKGNAAAVHVWLTHNVTWGHLSAPT